MDERELQAHVRDAYNLRIGPAMGHYLMEKVQAAGGAAAGGLAPVIGGDLLTGRPRRVEVSLAKLVAGRSVNKSELS